MHIYAHTSIYELSEVLPFVTSQKVLDSVSFILFCVQEKFSVGSHHNSKWLLEV